MDSLLGSAALGMRQGLQNQQNTLNDFHRQAGLATLGGIQTFTSAGTSAIQAGTANIGRELVAKVLSIREELQAEINEWLPEL